MTTTPDAEPLDIDALHDRVSARLARGGQLYTSRRRRLVELLAEHGGPISLPTLLDADSDLRTSSAYRNLEVLERSNLVHRINTGADYAHFELSEHIVGHHHHFICDDCGDIADVHLDDEFERTLDATLQRAAANIEFTPGHHRLDLHGQCSECAADD